MERYQEIGDIQRDNIRKEFEKLEYIEKKYLESTKKYRIGQKIFRYLLFINLIFFFLAIALITYDIHLPYQINILRYTRYTPNALLFAFCIFFLFEMYSSSKCSELQLKNHDLIFLETYRVIINLDRYGTDTNSDIYKKAVMGNLEKIIARANNWEYGNLIITKTLVGIQIDSLKENLTKKTLGYVNDENIQVISHLIEIFNKFLIYLLNPSIEQMKEINLMFDLYSHDKYEIPSKLDKIMNYMYDRPRLKRISFGIIFSLAIYIFGIYIFKLGNSDIFNIMVVTFFSASASAHYFVSIKRTNINKF